MPRWSVPARLLTNALTGVAWEVTGNSDTIIKLFRARAISFNRDGDTVINAVSDSVVMVAGFLVATQLPARVSLPISLAIEALTTSLVRDGPIIDTVMRIQPIDTLKALQIAGH